MVRAVFLQPDGSRREVEAKAGASLMDAAVKNSVDGIAAECGGACACATCHVYVPVEWMAIVGPPSAMELDMLEFAENCGPESRLSCQIKMTEELEGLTVQVASAA